ncbi:membrane lipoprotein lipid attachment site-containing protein [Paenibacillus sp. CGMCC 1.18879]|uniref:membrane lipoprotein lipid attachment site-containing protein n=1 Tax=Paenibacillus sp. CGMCC 1.18879 TaxID=2834466 RepID=UPI001CA9B0F7|nr:membrane lipoprotein lipid attachment site-containing protein [Paenibacillus sp. CGMCC 1.18879]MBY9078849.1 membrane lipoprotein lipid attachment site-containing protein [Paenibacillus sp. CGMCC 1.18879]
MKKIILIALVLFTLTSCSNNPNDRIKSAESPEVESDENQDTVYYGDYQMGPDDFNNLIKNNPIDKDHDLEFREFDGSEEFSTGNWIQLENKYYDIWENEMNATLSKLKLKLNKEEVELLEETQREWESYHLNENKFVTMAFLDKDYFGTQGYVSSTIVATSRVRERTIKLMEYYYVLNHYQLEFDYKGK